MGHVNRTARKPLEVTIMFEPSRLAAEHWADAYRGVWQRFLHFEAIGSLPAKKMRTTKLNSPYKVGT